MTWKAIGKSVAGTSHIAVEKPCEDALCYTVAKNAWSAEALVCCVSDGAGSAAYASAASTHIATRAAELLEHVFLEDTFSEASVFKVAETIYDELQQMAEENGVPISEYAATMLACVLTPETSVFLQIGDGAIVRKNETGAYQLIWWPQTGEYHNTTFFLVDNANMPNLKVLITDDRTTEVALLTDGLQMLALSVETQNAHQPFFDGLFAPLRHAADADKISVLNGKLEEWLNSAAINNRTDDDKTLFLATRLAP